MNKDDIKIILMLTTIIVLITNTFLLYQLLNKNTVPKEITETHTESNIEPNELLLLKMAK